MTAAVLVAYSLLVVPVDLAADQKIACSAASVHCSVAEAAFCNKETFCF